MAVAPGSLFKRSILLFIAIGFLALLFYLYYLVGMGNVVSVIQQTDLFYYALAFVAFLANVLFFSLTWHSLLFRLSIKVKFRRLFRFVLIGMFLDCVVPEPGWSGDLTKSYLLSKASGQDPGKTVASVVGQKILTMAISLGDLILGLIIMSLKYTLSNMILMFITAVVIILTCSLVTVLYLSMKPKATKRIVDWFVRLITFVRRGRWDSSNSRLKIEETLNTFHEGIKVLSNNPRGLVQPIVLSILAWGFDVSVIFLVFASLKYPIPVDKVLIVYALTGSLQAIGISVIGFTEIVLSSSYAVLGIPLAVSSAATLLTRFVTFWFKLALTYGAVQLTGVELLLGRRQTGLENKANSKLNLEQIEK